MSKLTFLLVCDRVSLGARVWARRRWRPMPSFRPSYSSSELPQDLEVGPQVQPPPDDSSRCPIRWKTISHWPLIGQGLEWNRFFCRIWLLRSFRIKSDLICTNEFRRKKMRKIIENIFLAFWKWCRRQTGLITSVERTWNWIFCQSKASIPFSSNQNLLFPIERN